jgi:hypothetical protein
MADDTEAAQGAAPTEDPAFHPPICAVEAGEDLRAERERFQRDMQPHTARWQPHAQARLDTAQEVVDSLARYHADVVDHTDVDLTANSRWVAILESTSRCIGLADALLDQLRRGYASETAGTARVLVEALDLAVALADGDEAEAKRWMRGKQYPTKTAARERRNVYARVIEGADRKDELAERAAATLAAVEAAAEKPIGSAADAMNYISGRVYGNLSAGAHNLRHGYSDGIAHALRLFTYGRHSDFRVRSVWIELGEGLIEQTCLDVATALAVIVGVEAVRDATLALTAHIHRARQLHPIR